MTTFASVGVSRIQTHLARCRSLWGRRGASDALVRLTQSPQPDSPNQGSVVAEILQRHPEVGINPDAPALDGEIALVGADPGQVAAAARAIVDRIQLELPAIDASIRIWHADTYADTFTIAADETNFVPPVSEYPPVRSCDECQTGDATDTLTSPTFPLQLSGLRVCRDCHTRAPRPGRQRTFTVPAGRDVIPNGFAAERWLLSTINAELAPRQPLEQLADFGQLAQQISGGDSRHHTNEGNHTALLFADANGLGGIFRALRWRAVNAHKDDRAAAVTDIKKVSAAIKRATDRAMVDATLSIITDNDTKLPVIPHIRGGDDLLVSLPAPRAWAFTSAFLLNLRTEFAKPDGVNSLVPAGLQQPTVSAGLVICKATFPFGIQVDLVNRLIADAKTSGGGRQWTITWLDVTAEGSAPLPVTVRQPWTLDELSEREPAIVHLRTLMGGTAEGSMRADLSDPDIGAAALKIALRANRLPDTVGRLLQKLDIQRIPTDRDVHILLDLISLGRWWR